MRSLPALLVAAVGGAAARGTALILWLCVVGVAPGAAQQVERPRTPKVLVIGMDGVRPDVLRAVPTPNIDALIRSGAYSDRAQTGIPTVSGPSWTSMLTGVWKEKHRIVSNDFPFADHGLSRYPDFLSRIELLRPELRTFAVADWPPLMEPQGGGAGSPMAAVIGDRIDVRIRFDGGRLGWAAADERSVAAAVEEIRANDPAALFVYLGNPDEVSHHTGSIEDEYRAAIARADRQVGQLVEAVRARPSYAAEDWLILISTDHGRLQNGSHGGDSEAERTIFFIASGPGVQSGTILPPPRIVDVAATALAYLGLGPRPEWELDGRAVALEPR